jgi:hypothetical protein
MNPINDPRRELLEEVFPPSTHSDSPSLASVLDSIRRERRSRAQRRCALAATACAAVTLFVLSSMWTSHTPQPDASSARMVAAPGARSQPEAVKVERVDDRGVLDRLDSTPSALIEWPDGRRTLMVLVSPRGR